VEIGSLGPFGAAWVTTGTAKQKDRSNGVPMKADSNVLECLLDKGFVAFVTNVADVEKGSIFAAPVRKGQLLLPHHVHHHPDQEGTRYPHQR
jgi:phage host-nuclease inhibitor protein Gam